MGSKRNSVTAWAIRNAEWRSIGREIEELRRYWTVSDASGVALSAQMIRAAAARIAQSEKRELEA